MTTPPLSSFIGASVSFRRRVIGSTGEPVSEWTDWRKNLISDAGLDMPPSALWKNLVGYVAVGTGTRPTKRDSGTITAARSGTAVTASAGFFVAADVGRTIKWDSGASTKITAYTAADNVTVADAGTDATSEFTVWYTSDSSHEAEVAAFGTYQLSLAIVDNVWTITMRGTSSVFSTARILREIGWRPAATGTLFGRALIPGGGDSVAAGQQYQVDVALSLKVSPISATAAGNVGTGLDTTGSYGFTGWGCGAAGENTSNTRIFADANRDGNGTCSAEPSQSQIGLYATAKTGAIPSLALGAPNWAVYENGTCSRSAYVSGTHSVTWTRSYALSQANGTIAGVAVGYAGGETFRHLFATPVVANSLQTKSFSFTVSWGRELVN